MEFEEAALLDVQLEAAPSSFAEADLSDCPLQAAPESSDGAEEFPNNSDHSEDDEDPSVELDP